MSGNVLRLGDRVKTRGQVPVHTLRGPSRYVFAVLRGEVVELGRDVRVRVTDWGAASLPDFSSDIPPARFGYEDLVRDA